ncbi:MAG TPA: hypothetical protein VNO32_32405, partial [Candidatus Acidoferrum sp.]|nr:hypothetical protein [Candidatus Acidoferrum sp.]
AVNAHQVFCWRKKYREGRLGKATSSKLLPVTSSDVSGGKSGRASGTTADGAVVPLARQRDSSRSRERRRGGAAYSDRVFARMIGLAAGTRIWIAAEVTSLRRASRIRNSSPHSKKKSFRSASKAVAADLDSLDWVPRFEESDFPEATSTAGGHPRGRFSAFGLAVS